MAENYNFNLTHEDGIRRMPEQIAEENPCGWKIYLDEQGLALRAYLETDEGKQQIISIIKEHIDGSNAQTGIVRSIKQAEKR